MVVGKGRLPKINPMWARRGLLGGRVREFEMVKAHFNRGVEGFSRVLLPSQKMSERVTFDAIINEINKQNSCGCCYELQTTRSNNICTYSHAEYTQGHCLTAYPCSSTSGNCAV